MSFLNVAVVQAKGGAAKTTTAVLTSYAIAHQNVHVAMCDLDPQGAANAWLTQHPHPNVMVRHDPTVPLPDEIAFQIIDSEGMSRFEQVLKTLPDVALFLIPCSPSTLEVEGARNTVAYIKRWRPKALCRVVWNRLANPKGRGCVPGARDSQPEALKERADYIGAPGFRTVIPRRKAFEYARNTGWAALRAEDRELWSHLAFEVLTLLTKQMK